MKQVMGSVVAALAMTAVLATAQADGIKNVGARPTPDQLINELVPSTGVTAIRERGLRLRAANPATAGEESTEAETPAPMPAVALDVKFALNSAELTDEAKDTIQRLASALNSEQLAGYHFRLEGHTDARGSPEYNLVLSKRRAAAVRDYLGSLGVDPRRLQLVGRGQEDPLDRADPLSGVNRRVQVANLGR